MLLIEAGPDDTDLYASVALKMPAMMLERCCWLSPSAPPAAPPKPIPIPLPIPLALAPLGALCGDVTTLVTVLVGCMVTLPRGDLAPLMPRNWQWKPSLPCVDPHTHRAALAWTSEYV